MEFVDAMTIRLRPGERITATGNAVVFEVPDRGAAAETMHFVAPGRRAVVQMRGLASTRGPVTLTSSLGNTVTRIVDPGVVLFHFVIEPQPDEWYCENDDGNPPHPVSKGDSLCRLCGGTIRRGDQ